MRRPSPPPPGRGSGEPRLRGPMGFGLAAVTATLAIAFTAAAQAQLRDVGEQTGVDTPSTPVAKEDPRKLWSYSAGARYGGPEAQPEDVPEDSPTPLSVDLFAVAARDSGLALAGGVREAQGGERVPVAYRYAVDEEGKGAWGEIALPGEERSGFVAAIAWIDAGRALAVGGTGAYPRREPAGSEGEPCGKSAAQDRAGGARAWLYEGGAWRELRQRPDGEPGDELPDAMRALTALDFRFHTTDPKNGVGPLELGVAGGLCELWHWADGGFLREPGGGFSAPYSNLSPADRVQNASSLRYRVRHVAFAKPSPDVIQSRRAVRAYAVTSGCCLPDSATGPRGAATLTYTPPASAAPDKPEELARGSWSVASAEGQPDSRYSITATQTGPKQSNLQYTENPQGFPDTFATGTVASPGGPESPEEPPSTVGGQNAELQNTSARLLDGDGDAMQGGTAVEGGVKVLAPPDGVPDWSVGELRSSGQAIAYPTHPKRYPNPNPRPTEPLCGFDSPQSGEAVTPTWFNNEVWFPFVNGRGQEFQQCAGNAGKWLPGWSPTSAERVRDSQRSHRLLRLPTYALNAVEILDEAGLGWAVGDHGAIVEYREGAKQGPSPNPPELGEPRPAKLPERSPYDELRAGLGGGGAGEVPPLRARPFAALPEPRAVPSGSPRAQGGAREIVMSRSGDEGWAVGPSSAELGGFGETSLYHYDGAAWSACDLTGVEDQLPADRACEGVAALLTGGRDFSNKPKPIALVAAARVPLERDGDPANDDEFEVVAISSAHSLDPQTNERLGPAIVRYRGGRWRFEDAGAREAVTTTIALRDIACTAPDDCWILGVHTSAWPLPGEPVQLYRFDGRRWIDCLKELGDACHDPGGLARLNVEVKVGNTSFKDQVNGIVAAGDRVYLFGRRVAPVTGDLYPAIVYHDREAKRWSSENGGFDPVRTDPSPAREDQGEVGWLAVAERPGGRYEGWALGSFGRSDARVHPLLFTPFSVTGFVDPRTVLGPLEGPPATRLLRLPPGKGWEKFFDTGAVREYLDPGFSSGEVNGLAVTPGAGPASAAYISHARRLLGFDPKRGRWETVTLGLQPGAGNAGPVAPDNRGGLWAGRGNFFHHTDRPRRAVFEEVAHPLAQAELKITALAGAGDGSAWLGTDSDALYRHDSLAGWERVRIPGWDPGRVVTVRSAVNALALNRDGEGIAVGKGGRIANLSPSAVALDRAAGKPCRDVPAPPCGTAHDLRAAAAGPGGSALVAGEGRTLLWRPAGGDLRAIEGPPGLENAELTGVALPAPERAFVTTDSGYVYAGRPAGERWSWRAESLDARGRPLSLGRDKDKKPIALRAIALGEDGHGYAVGDDGLVLERQGEGERPWRRLASGLGNDLTAVALSAGGGSGALIGGDDGLVLTRFQGRFEVARHADFEYAEASPPVLGLALLSGGGGGSEAFAASGPAEDIATATHDSGTSRLFHYRGEGERPRPLPDAPAPRPGELSLAAFGKTECRLPAGTICAHEIQGSDEDYDVVARRVVEEIAERAGRPAGPRLALFSGDAVESGGMAGAQAVDEEAQKDGTVRSNVGLAVEPGQISGPRKLRRWSALVADRLRDRGVPLFGAIGGQDLGEPSSCASRFVTTGTTGQLCAPTRDHLKTGENVAWRQALSAQPWPRGRREQLERRGELAFRAVGDSGLARRHTDTESPEPDGAEGAAGKRRAPTGGASTHYAVDILDTSGERERALARLVVVDTSPRSLTAADPLQQPLELRGGQAAWLEEMLCTKDSVTDRAAGTFDCTRAPGQQAIVVSNTPTYTYAELPPTETQTDASVFETILMRNGANLVVSGRLGWNGVYWASAPGVHEPCPGGAYQTTPPAPGTRLCGRSEEDLPEPPSTAPGASQLSETMRALDAPPAPAPVEAAAGGLGGEGVLPFVVASGGGGKLGAQGTAAEGFWHGYTVVRLDASGDPARTIVEQRPVYDWVSLTAQAHVLRPGQRMTLRGTGRGPIGRTNHGGDSRIDQRTARFDRIDSPAITHRYDLLEADPERPWLQREDADGSYVLLDPSIATVDSQTGRIRVGRGNHPRAFAIGMLSVGDHVATYPLVFEPRRSFRPKPAASLPALPLPKVAASAAAALQSPQAPPPVNPTTPQVDLPVPPAIPSLPTPTASPPTPPAPPAPPPPPVSPQATPLDLVTSPVGLNVAPQATVIPPPAPPIQPAPPGGARREARQRQAATAKSEEGGGEGSEVQSLGGDAVTGPETESGQLPFRRRARAAAEPGSITAIHHTDQPSAWARTALYGGGLTALAALLAIGWSLGRPRPRRRPPAVPAPARTWARRR